jgi:hypothetical protein
MHDLRAVGVKSVCTCVCVSLGQLGAFARADNPAPLPVGYLVPLAGRIVADGRYAFEVRAFVCSAFSSTYAALSSQLF